MKTNTSKNLVTKKKQSKTMKSMVKEMPDGMKRKMKGY